jgi:ParB family transcriptional regulator, chromosome partitioning protein
MKKTLIPNLMSSKSNEWYTHPKYIDAARRVMGGIDLDPASCATANLLVKATTYYDQEADGLSQPWFGRVWLNPPYGRACHPFVKKLVEEYETGRVTEAILLVNGNGNDTLWFQPLYDYVLCFSAGRPKFIPGDAENKKSGPAHGSCFVYFGPNPQKFNAEFKAFGNVVHRYRVTS